MMPEQSKTSNSGSRWLRWDPHVHAPGTILNDQFKGDWNAYLQQLENTAPAIQAIGVTDYYSTDLYERVLEEQKKGRLPSCGLIFPNIEMRLDKGTVKDKWVNIHLLVDPMGQDHLSETKRFLQNLTFKAHGDTYHCNRDDLIRLGRKADSKLVNDRPAHAYGAQQFKVSFEQLRIAYKESDWAQRNVLVAIAGGETDGTSGVRAASDVTLRQEVEKFAHIIFASSAAQREFWLGMRGVSADDIRGRYDALKPCMHGSDAHDAGSVGAPTGNRYSWIKGDAAFDTLKQACIDPAGRAYVGEEPPTTGTPSQIIAGVDINDAPWAATPSLELNPGLVAIIGARGSGKTALADIIAQGCDATEGRLTDASFLTRARDLLADASVTLRWLEGDPSSRELDGWDAASSAAEYPRARYLSQKFVEDLCSADGMTDELLREIERVIFDAHPVADRDGAVNFEELREMRTARFREARGRDEEALADLSERIGTELEKAKLVVGLTKQIEEKTKVLEGYARDRGKLVARGNERRVARLNELTAASETVQGYLRFYADKQTSILAIQDEVRSFRLHGAPEALRRMSERHRNSALKPEEWSPFLVDYKGPIDATIETHLEQARQGATTRRGVANPAIADLNKSLIPDEAVLNNQPLARLQAEISRLQQLVSVDKQTAAKFAAISAKISEETAQLNRLKAQLENCRGASARVVELAKERESAYQRVFDAILSEESILKELYGPLMARLAASGSTLSKLSFSVTRTADIAKWAKAGEALLDLRMQGAFRGKGTLEQLAKEDLAPAWEKKNAQGVTTAMSAFRAKNQRELLDNVQIPKSEQTDYRDWLKRFAKWLYGTDHIVLQYSIDYAGVDIRKLSPGTRGIVLLLLYLALDDNDDRPLIIDQPEENLDPKSIYDELVGLFLEAKTKRQVIMVTHNANLVVNTDADQIIIAQAEPREPNALPTISYLSGGLERADIRKAVCEILEGGEKAFQERARRLRVSLSR